MGVYEKIVEVGFGERLLDADAVESGLRLGRARIEDGVVPEARRPVPALWHPDAPGVFANVAHVGGDGGAHLCSYALIGAQQRHISVSRAAGDDLDQAGVVEVPEALDDVSPKRVEVGKRSREEAAPEAGGLGQVSIAGLDEVSLILARGDDLASEVLGELGDEERVRQLLQQDR